MVTTSTHFPKELSMSSSRFDPLLSAALLGLLMNTAAVAADTETTPIVNQQVDDFAAGKKALDARNWKQASESFARVVANNPRNADAYNLLGYSLRWQNRYDEAYAAYGKALALDPQHKGALNYSGIAYLKQGRKDMAEAQLGKLQKICATCDETAQLTKAIADAKAVKN